MSPVYRNLIIQQGTEQIFRLPTTEAGIHSLVFSVTFDSVEVIEVELETDAGFILFSVPSNVSSDLQSSKYKYSIIANNKKLYEGLLQLDWTPGHGGFNYG